MKNAINLDKQLESLIDITIEQWRFNKKFPDIWKFYGLSVPIPGAVKQLRNSIKAHWLICWYLKKHVLAWWHFNRKGYFQYFDVLKLAERETGIKITV